MYAKDSSGNIIGKADIVPNGGFTEVNLLFTVEDTVSSIGFYVDTNGTDWGEIDQVELGYLNHYETVYEEPEFIAPVAKVSMNIEGAGTVMAEMIGVDSEKGTADWKLSACPEEGNRFVKWVREGEEQTLISTNPDYMTVIQEEQHFIAVFEYENPEEKPEKPVQPDDNNGGQQKPDDQLKPEQQITQGGIQNQDKLPQQSGQNMLNKTEQQKTKNLKTGDTASMAGHIFITLTAGMFIILSFGLMLKNRGKRDGDK